LSLLKCDGELPSVMETSRSIQKEIDTVRGPSRTDGTRQRCQRRVSGFCGPVLCCFATFPEMPEEPSIAIVRPVIAGAGSPSSSGLAASMPSVGFASNSRDSRPPPGRTPSVSNRDQGASASPFFCGASCGAIRRIGPFPEHPHSLRLCGQSVR
jgi:hypothetical protein